MINERSKTPLCEYKQAGCLPNAIGQAAVLVTGLNPMAKGRNQIQIHLALHHSFKKQWEF